MNSPIHMGKAIDRRAGVLSKIGARRYALENRLLLYPSLSDNRSVAMRNVESRKEFRGVLAEELARVRDEFDAAANLPIENWIV